MTDFKRRTLYLSTGKQIKLFGNSMAIGKSLEVGEGYAPNIFSYLDHPSQERLLPEIEVKTEDGVKTKTRKPKKNTASVSNPHRLTRDEVLEMADYNIRLWMELKDNVRTLGVTDPGIFHSDGVK
jgi:hypothetical protein